VPAELSAETLVRAIRGSDKASITAARLFDRFDAADGLSLAIEVTLQPTDKSFTDEQIEQLLQTNDSLPAAGAMLVHAANAAGGRDNIAVVLARAKAGSGAFAKSWWSFWR